MAGGDFVLCGLITVGFVATLYLWNILRPGDNIRHRNHPTVIKRRFVSSILSVVFAIFVVKSRGLRSDCTPSFSEGFSAEPIPLGQLLGLRTDKWVPALIIPLLLTAVIFLGPLLMALLDTLTEPRKKEEKPTFASLSDVVAQLQSCLYDLKLWRNLVIGPATEELLFRSCLCPLLLAGGWQPVTVVFCGAVFFGCAHVHHLFGLMLQEGYHFREALLVVALQVAYTTIFGWYATYLFLRSAHILAPMAAHVFCNHMGLPDFAAIANHRHRKVLIGATVLGVVTFGFSLEPVTRPAVFHARGVSSIYWPRPRFC